MKSKTVFATIPLLLIWMMIPISCLHNGSTVKAESTIEAEMIYHGTNCFMDQREAHLRWISSRTEFKKVWEKLHSNRFGDSIHALPEVDFESYGILVINMGFRNTGGYAVELADKTVQVKDRVAKVSVHWISPSPENLVLQVITTPCLFLTLPRRDLKWIQVVDDNGELKLSTHLLDPAN